MSGAFLALTLLAALLLINWRAVLLLLTAALIALLALGVGVVNSAGAAPVGQVQTAGQTAPAVVSPPQPH
jgi:hypothetical protein